MADRYCPYEAEGRDLAPSRILRAGLFLVSSATLGWLVKTGKITQIVHPRMIPWIVAAGLIFLVLSCHEVFFSRKRRSKDEASFYYPLGFVLVVAALVVQINAVVPGQLQASPESRAFQSAQQRAQSGASATAPAGKDLPSSFVLRDDNYWDLYNRLYDDPSLAKGRPIVVQGFVYRGEGLPGGGLIVARNLMWCCSADLSIIGFTLEGPKVGALKDNVWIEVRGVLDVVEADLAKTGTPAPIPIIKVESARPVKRAASTTIFPY